MRFCFSLIFVIYASIAHSDTFRLEDHMVGENLKGNHIWVKGQLKNGTDFCYSWTHEQCDGPKACQSCRVRYLLGAEREARRLFWDKKKELWRGADGKPYDTRKENEKHHVKVTTITDRERFKTWGIVPGIWVMSPSGKLYTSVEHVTGKFHHSSFLAGGLVEGAGLVVFEHGKITHIDNESGHYRPDRSSFNRLLKALHVTNPLIVEYASASLNVGSATRVRSDQPKEVEQGVPAVQSSELEYDVYKGDIGYTSYRGYESVHELLPEQAR